MTNSSGGSWTFLRGWGWGGAGGRGANFQSGIITARKRSYVFTGVCLSTGGGLCPRGVSLSRVVSVQGSRSIGVSVPRGLCPGGLCRGSLSRRVSVQGDLSSGASVQGIYVQGEGYLSRGLLSKGALSRGSLSRGSLSRRISIQGDLCHGDAPLLVWLRVGGTHPTDMHSCFAIFC